MRTIRYANGSKRGSRDIPMAMCMRIINDNATALEICGKEGRDEARYIWATGENIRLEHQGFNC